MAAVGQRPPPAVVAGVWAAAFVVASVLTLDSYDGGSILGPLSTLGSAIVATGAAGLVRSGRVTWRTAGRAAAGTFAALCLFFGTVFTWFVSVASFTGCSFHCDADDRSVPIGLAFMAATVVLAGVTAWTAAWAFSASLRASKALAGVAGLLAGALTAVSAASVT